MIKSTILTIGLLTALNGYAGCLQDTLEIGDIGPASQLVCNRLVSMYPDKHIEITGREIKSQNNVKILLTVEDQSGSLNYRLVAADWMLSRTRIATHY